MYKNDKLRNLFKFEWEILVGELPLTERQQSVITKYYLQSKTIQEIAESENVHLNTINGDLRRIRFLVNRYFQATQPLENEIKRKWAPYGD